MMPQSQNLSVFQDRLGGMTREQVIWVEQETIWEPAWGAGGYGAGLGQGVYLGGAAGKLGAAAALGQGYGEGATGYLGPMAGNGHAGYGNGYGDGLGAALGTGGYAGQVQGGYGDGGYPYPAQQLNLGAEGAKTANKYGDTAGYGPQQTGFGAQLGATQDVLGEQAGKYDRGNAALGNVYKG
ncbi:hypothetical protein CesoFtcFv8_018541 [Champsocephalus esox]|uniref:Uncharacterized protein n=1 Tax=Champsocephalus esox TaxID=159716 RepID=A0AAN8BGD3_9TELE|nr:hypothetical protein CesoFtcFv8_018541 [Champsocephalus esox]